MEVKENCVLIIGKTYMRIMILWCLELVQWFLLETRFFQNTGSCLSDMTATLITACAAEFN